MRPEVGAARAGVRSRSAEVPEEGGCGRAEGEGVPGATESATLLWLSFSTATASV